MQRALAALTALAIGAVLGVVGPSSATALTDEAVVQGQATRLYSAYFLRAPDLTGLRYWVGEMNDGRSVQNVSQFFAGSPEFRTRYGSLDHGQFVDLVYRNVLGRSPDATGRAFWVNGLTTGTHSRGRVMTGFSESPEFVVKTGTTPPTPSRSFGDGLHDGAAVAGTWRNVSDFDGSSCYWWRLTGNLGTEDEVIAGDMADDGGRLIVTIEATDALFDSSSCGTWVPDVGPTTLSPTDPFAHGSYRVGRDVAPGTWRSDGGGIRDCRWERVSGFSGESEQIIEQDAGPGPLTVTISSTDVGFRATEECGVWVKVA